MRIDEIKERLIRLDEDVDLDERYDGLDFKCYIVGGSALLMMGYITRATHDIDVLQTVPNNLRELFKKYDMNDRVIAYATNFADGYEERAIKVDIKTQRVTFYTLSLEDLVISKLCTTRDEKRKNKDDVDIQNERILKELNWNRLEELAKNLELSMFSSINIETFKSNYNEYVRRFRDEEVDI